MAPSNGQAPVENEFLQRLLTLQQDGKAAISAPATWDSEPLLRVETQLDRVVVSLFEAIRAGVQDGKCAQWHFFVGSPGNGKSAGTGELVRALMAAGFAVRDPEGRSLKDLPASVIPYELHVFAPGMNHACAFIAQDASVVPDPYADNANPADALTDLLKRAARKGVSLIVCTNRGVLERAFGDHYLDPTSNSTAWFATIKASVEDTGPLERKLEEVDRKGCQSVSFGYTSLDRRSLLVGRHTFDQLVRQAVDGKNWTTCNHCPAQNRCPFFQNRRWLADGSLRSSFTQVVRQAEILSGQVVVFREALALLSLVLAGCPHDYKDGSPCKWVHARLAENDFFPLLSRRVYMTLFSAYAPLGLEPFEDDRAQQKDSLGKLADAVVGPKADLCRQALLRVRATETQLSSDVGVERLVGSQGILRTVDPFSDIQGSQFHERWDDDERAFFRSEEWSSELERECAAIWGLLNETAEGKRQGLAGAYPWLSRWITSFTHRAGALVEQVLPFGGEVGQLVNILELTGQLDVNGLRLIDQIESELWKMLHSSGEGTEIASFGRLKGDWVQTKLRPRIDTGANRGVQEIVLQLTFGSRTKIPLNTMAFVWLKRRSDRAMSNARFPVEYLETARDALVRAASESGYSLVDSDIELIVTLPDDKRATLKRTQGRVIIDGV